MNRLFLWRMFLVSVMFCIHPTTSFATTQERIKDFSVEARVEANRHVVITEHITYDFGTLERHGIYRDIPVSYTRYGGTYDVRLHVIRVLQNTKPAMWSETSGQGMIHVKIGSATSYVTGIVNYTIEYETDRVIQEFTTGPELYWNVTGNEWGIPIDSASFRVTGPAEAIEVACYTGVVGNTETRCTTTKNTVTNTVPLNPNEGLTVAVRWQSGVFEVVPWWKPVRWFFADNLILLLPFGVFAFMFFIWLKYGKDPRGRGTVIAEYEPPANMTPLEMSALMTQQVMPSGMLGTLIDLARRGYMRIVWDTTKKEGSRDAFEFVKLRDMEETAPVYEKNLFELFFGVNDRATFGTMSVSSTSTTTIRSIHEDVFVKLRRDGLFDLSPEKIRGGWYFFAFLFVFVGFQFLKQENPLVSIVPLLLSGIIIAGFGHIMPRMTPKGAERLEQVEGFKLFLSVTEKDRLAFANAPAVRPEMFEKFLPFAIALGVDELWAKQFASMMVPVPSYLSVEGGAWNPGMNLLFAHSIMQSSNATSAFSYARGGNSGGSGFGGGGSSGGGFGGGGGGSW